MFITMTLFFLSLNSIAHEECLKEAQLACPIDKLRTIDAVADCVRAKSAELELRHANDAAASAADPQTSPEPTKVCDIERAKRICQLSYDLTQKDDGNIKMYERNRRATDCHIACTENSDWVKSLTVDCHPDAKSILRAFLTQKNRLCFTINDNSSTTSDNQDPAVRAMFDTFQDPEQRAALEEAFNNLTPETRRVVNVALRPYRDEQGNYTFVTNENATIVVDNNNKAVNYYDNTGQQHSTLVAATSVSEEVQCSVGRSAQDFRGCMSTIYGRNDGGWKPDAQIAYDRVCGPNDVWVGGRCRVAPIRVPVFTASGGGPQGGTNGGPAPIPNNPQPSQPTIAAPSQPLQPRPTQSKPTPAPQLTTAPQGAPLNPASAAPVGGGSSAQVAAANPYQNGSFMMGYSGTQSLWNGSGGGQNNETTSANSQMNSEAKRSRSLSASGLKSLESSDIGSVSGAYVGQGNNIDTASRVHASVDGVRGSSSSQPIVTAAIESNRNPQVTSEKNRDRIKVGDEGYFAAPGSQFYNRGSTQKASNHPTKKLRRNSRFAQASQGTRCPEGDMQCVLSRVRNPSSVNENWWKLGSQGGRLPADVGNGRHDVFKGVFQFYNNITLDHEGYIVP